MKRQYTYSTNERADYSDINCHAWKGNVVREHAHRDYYEIIIATGGELYNSVGSDDFYQRSGDVLLIRPDAYHKMFSKDGGAHYNIAVRTPCFERLISGKPPIRELFEKREYITVTLSDATKKYVFECIEKIGGANLTSYSYTLAETVISVIFSSIMEITPPEESSREAVSYYCRDAIRKIENGSLSDKNASEIYGSYPVSHSAFIAEFKRITGKNPSDYLKETKLYRAKNLLLTTSTSVLDISYEVGYDSVSHFIKCFKKKYGVTPHKYRNENKK